MSETPFSAFQEMFEGLPSDPIQAGIEALLRNLSEDSAALLRLCAIPHQFDVAVLRALAPSLSDEGAAAFCAESARLSLVRTDEDGLALHDTARAYLFQQWLSHRGQDFTEASVRLVALFDAHARESEGDKRNIALRRRMFHRIGADAARGIEDFEQLCRQARKNGLLSECEALIALTHEYDRILQPLQAGIIVYHEGKLAADRRLWPLAEELFRKVEQNSQLPERLRLRAMERLGWVYLQQRRWNDAIQILEVARPRAERSAPEHMPFILHDMGVAYRDSRRDLDEARKLLETSIKVASDLGNAICIAAGYNSLGTLLRQIRKNREAIAAYEQSLAALTGLRDDARSAQVYNNLGAVYTELADWNTAEEMYQRSLKIKEQAGDTLGQAKSLSNVMLVYQNQRLPDKAIEAGKKAIVMFEQVRDQYDAAVVRRNLAKLHRRLGERELAMRYFSEAIDSFRAAADQQDADLTQKELNAYLRPIGLPWWVWILIVFLVLFVVLVVVGMFLE